MDKNHVSNFFQFLIGLFITFNVYIFPWAEKSPRISDAISILVVLALTLQLLIGARINKAVFWTVLLIGLLLAPWLINDITEVGVFGSINSFRWLLGLFMAIAVLQLCSIQQSRYPFIFGLISGAFLGLGVIVLQYFGLTELTQTLGLAPQETLIRTFAGEVRPPGMFGHPNASLAVASLVVPLVIGLVEEERLKPLWVALSLVAVSVGSALTLNRSAALVSLAVCGLWLLVRIKTGKTLVASLTVLSFVVVGVAIFGPPGGWERWTDEQNIVSNSSERIFTNAFSWNLALQHPFGLGYDYREKILEGSGIGATHNAFLQLALLGGVPLAAFLAVKLFLHCISIISTRNIESWLALHIFGLFLFEEHFNSPVFIVLALWLALSPIGLRGLLSKHKAPTEVAGVIHS